MRTLIVAALAVGLVAAPARAADKYDGIASVLALAIFVSKNCPTMRVKEETIMRLLELTGVSMETMQREPYSGTIIRLATQLSSDPTYSCEVAWTYFGSEGTKAANLLSRQ